MTLVPGGIPQFYGDGKAKAVVTGDVVASSHGRLGDLYEIAIKAVPAWERLLADFGLAALKNGT